MQGAFAPILRSLDNLLASLDVSTLDQPDTELITVTDLVIVAAVVVTSPIIFSHRSSIDLALEESLRASAQLIKNAAWMWMPLSFPCSTEQM